MFFDMYVMNVLDVCQNMYFFIFFCRCFCVCIIANVCIFAKNAFEYYF